MNIFRLGYNMPRRRTFRRRRQRGGVRTFTDDKLAQVRRELELAPTTQEMNAVIERMFPTTTAAQAGTEEDRRLVDQIYNEILQRRSTMEDVPGPKTSWFSNPFTAAYRFFIGKQNNVQQPKDTTMTSRVSGVKRTREESEETDATASVAQSSRSKRARQEDSSAVRTRAPYNMACQDADKQKDMGYHLHCDIVHDLQTARKTENYGTYTLSALHIPDSGVNGGKIDEDAASAYLKNLINLPGVRNARFTTSKYFITYQNTAVYPDNDVMGPLFLGVPNNNVAIVQDNGSQLFDKLGVHNLLTFGSVLDQAGKPVHSDDNPFYYDQPSYDISLCKYGFKDPVTLSIRQFDGRTTMCAMTMSNGKKYDAITTEEIGAIEEPNKSKPINKTTPDESGYFSSIDQISKITETDVSTDEIQRYYAGKALGDTTLVASIEELLDARNRVQLRSLYNASAIPRLDRIVLKTGDRLNHVRAILRDVPSIYQHPRQTQQLSSTYEFIPSSVDIDVITINNSFREGILQIRDRLLARYDALKDAFSALTTVNEHIIFGLFDENMFDTIQLQTTKLTPLVNDINLRIDTIKERIRDFYTLKHTEASVQGITLEQINTIYKTAEATAAILTPKCTTLKNKSEGYYNSTVIVFQTNNKIDTILNTVRIRFKEMIEAQKKDKPMKEIIDTYFKIDKPEAQVGGEDADMFSFYIPSSIIGIDPIEPSPLVTTLLERYCALGEDLQKSIASSYPLLVFFFGYVARFTTPLGLEITILDFFRYLNVVILRRYKTPQVFYDIGLLDSLVSQVDAFLSVLVDEKTDKDLSYELVVSETAIPEGNDVDQFTALFNAFTLDVNREISGTVFDYENGTITKDETGAIYKEFKTKQDTLEERIKPAFTPRSSSDSPKATGTTVVDLTASPPKSSKLGETGTPAKQPRRLLARAESASSDTAAKSSDILFRTQSAPELKQAPESLPATLSLGSQPS
jgi:hypothetical protein